MRNIFLSCLILTLALSLFPVFPAFSQTETITIATYYPAPYGVYRAMRLFPLNNNFPACTANDEGTIYYDNVAHQVKICTEDAAGNHVPLDIGLWTRNGNNVFTINNVWNVGIGTNSPTAKLDVRGGIRVGNTNVCNATNRGTLRYRNNNVQVCTNSGWASVGGQFGGMYTGFWWICWSSNPATGGCSCPAGYGDYDLWPWWFIHYCYRA